MVPVSREERIVRAQRRRGVDTFSPVNEDTSTNSRPAGQLRDSAYPFVSVAIVVDWTYRSPEPSVILPGIQPPYLPLYPLYSPQEQ